MGLPKGRLGVRWRPGQAVGHRLAHFKLQALQAWPLSGPPYLALPWPQVMDPLDNWVANYRSCRVGGVGRVGSWAGGTTLLCTLPRVAMLCRHVLSCLASSLRDGGHPQECVPRLLPARRTQEMVGKLEEKRKAVEGARAEATSAKGGCCLWGRRGGARRRPGRRLGSSSAPSGAQNIRAPASCHP